MALPLIPLVGAAFVALLAMAKGKGAGASAPQLPATKPDVPPPVSVPQTPPAEAAVVAAAELGGVLVPSVSTPAEAAAASAAVTAAAQRDWQSAVVLAVQSGDARTLETVSTAMKADGLAAQAQTVQAVADALRADAVSANLEVSGVEVTVAEVKALEPPPPVPPPDPKLEAGKALALYLAPLAPWKEDRAKVAGYQTTLGLTADGKYGPGTAGALVDLGIIPPAPFYWPATGTSTAISAYRSKLRAMAVTDTARAQQWLDAATNCVR